MLVMSTEVSRHTGVVGALALAHELGFRAVELVPSMFGGDHGRQPSLPEDSEVQTLREALEANHVVAAAANAVFMPPVGAWAEEDQFVPAVYKNALARATPDEYARYVRWLVRIAPTLGITTINCLSLPFTGNTAEDTLRAFVERMRPVLDAAHERGISICLEHEAMCPLVRFEPGLRKLLDALPHPAFGLTIDISNLYVAGFEPYPYAYDAFAPRIRHIHLRGSRRPRPSDPVTRQWFAGLTALGDRRDTVFTTLRDGAVNVQGLLARLQADGYAGLVTLQPLARGDDNAQLPQMLRDDLAFVRELNAPHEHAVR